MRMTKRQQSNNKRRFSTSNIVLLLNLFKIKKSREE